MILATRRIQRDQFEAKWTPESSPVAENPIRPPFSSPTTASFQARLAVGIGTGAVLASFGGGSCGLAMARTGGERRAAVRRDWPRA
ncbi:hypothetical protein PanWU01x14_317660 [Parasponia andersonii]|uniref:Uncharacterized protein n=1 Tax=Parasponia andersonii TaxID=3476 RepID=A0A2P5AMK2_PARAD|nr:hypothetical protein PanWU01x14_317660 [Parasponia andersonii]